MVNKKENPPEAEKNPRKYKRIIPTRQAGTPANISAPNHVDELFEQAMGSRLPEIPVEGAVISEEQAPSQEKSPTEKIFSKPKIKTPTTTPSQGTPPSPGRQPTPPSHGQLINTFPVSPVSNFQKVTNTITKDAIPGGLFKPGKSKHVYDVLYGLTRGAIHPVREIRISKPKLRELAGVGSRITMDSCVEHLISVGLVRMTINDGGQHAGNSYEVFTPEEIGKLPMPTPPSQGSTGSQGTPGSTASSGSPAQNLGVVGSLENRQGSQGSESINTGRASESKTFSKTLSFNLDDDAPVIKVLEKLNEAARKTTGKDLTKKDLEKWLDLTEILINETVIAAARTGTVSAFMPFMTENLRRRLYSKRSAPGKKDPRPVHMDVGKGSEPEEITWHPQTPMNEEQRQKTLNALNEAKEINGVFFQEFKTFGEIEYTKEDFDWLLENLEAD